MESEQRTKNSFQERDIQDLPNYLGAELAGGLSRADLLESMRQLLSFTQAATYEWEDSEYALIYATIARSARTFESACLLLENGMAVQAAMVSRSLFEDVVVAHWVAMNVKRGSAGWLGEKFLRQRAAISDLQTELRQSTKFSATPPIARPEGIGVSSEDLKEEFGRKVAGDWWDPGREGDGSGKAVGLRKLVLELEEAARTHEMFHPRFAGGKESVLARMDQVIHKWLAQCAHHTVVGLPFAPIDRTQTDVSVDPMVSVAHTTSWLFTQQLFLLHELNGIDQLDLDVLWHSCLVKFVEIYLGPEEADRLISEFVEFHDL